MAIELHVKRIHTDSYDHLMIRIRRCLIKVGILDTHIARRVTAPSRRVVPGGLTGQCLGGYAYKEAAPPMRGPCEPVPEVIPIGKRPNTFAFYFRKISVGCTRGDHRSTCMRRCRR
jgi:hypothetical protein